MLFFRSSDARLSFSFAGTETSAKISTGAKKDASADSTACRRAAAGWPCGFVVVAGSGPSDDVGERVLRRKLPAEMNAAADAGVGDWKVEVSG